MIKSKLNKISIRQHIRNHDPVRKQVVSTYMPLTTQPLLIPNQVGGRRGNV